MEFSLCPTQFNQKWKEIQPGQTHQASNSQQPQQEKQKKPQLKRPIGRNPSCFDIKSQPFFHTQSSFLESQETEYGRLPLPTNNLPDKNNNIYNIKDNHYQELISENRQLKLENQKNVLLLRNLADKLNESEQFKNHKKDSKIINNCNKQNINISNSKNIITNNNNMNNSLQRSPINQNQYNKAFFTERNEEEQSDFNNKNTQIPNQKGEIQLNNLQQYQQIQKNQNNQKTRQQKLLRSKITNLFANQSKVCNKNNQKAQNSNSCDKNNNSNIMKIQNTKEEKQQHSKYCSENEFLTPHQLPPPVFNMEQIPSTISNNFKEDEEFYTDQSSNINNCLDNSNINKSRPDITKKSLHDNKANAENNNEFLEQETSQNQFLFTFSSDRRKVLEGNDLAKRNCLKAGSAQRMQDSGLSVTNFSLTNSQTTRDINNSKANNNITSSFFNVLSENNSQKMNNFSNLIAGSEDFDSKTFENLDLQAQILNDAEPIESEAKFNFPKKQVPRSAQQAERENKLSARKANFFNVQSPSIVGGKEGQIYNKTNYFFSGVKNNQFFLQNGLKNQQSKEGDATQQSKFQEKQQNSEISNKNNNSKSTSQIMKHFRQKTEIQNNYTSCTNNSNKLNEVDLLKTVRVLPKTAVVSQRKQSCKNINSMTSILKPQQLQQQSEEGKSGHLRNQTTAYFKQEDLQKNIGANIEQIADGKQCFPQPNITQAKSEAKIIKRQPSFTFGQQMFQQQQENNIVSSLMKTIKNNNVIFDKQKRDLNESNQFRKRMSQLNFQINQGASDNNFQQKSPEFPEVKQQQQKLQNSNANAKEENFEGEQEQQQQKRKIKTEREKPQFSNVQMQSSRQESKQICKVQENLEEEQHPLRKKSNSYSRFPREIFTVEKKKFKFVV